MGYLKELLSMMDDTSIVLFAKRPDAPDSKMPEAQCMSDAIINVECAAKMALDRFVDMRKRMV